MGMTWRRSPVVAVRALARTEPDAGEETFTEKSRGFRSPSGYRPRTCSFALTSKASTRLSSNSMTNSTSSPSRVRQCPIDTCSSSRETCLGSSPTTNVSSRLPSSVSRGWVHRGQLGWADPYQPRSDTGVDDVNFGCRASRAVQGLRPGGRHSSKNRSSSSRRVWASSISRCNVVPWRLTNGTTARISIGWTEFPG